MTESSAPQGYFHPAARPYRYTLLFFAALLPFGSYFAYDSIGALETTLIEKLHLDRSDIGDSYTAYSVAAIFIVFFGGLLIDKLGTRKASLLFSCLVALGALIVALSQNKMQLLAGRLVFGAGSESLVVAQSAIMARWFKGKELAFAFGISLTISRLGTLFSFNTEELIAEHFGDYRVALWAAFGLCVFSILANLVYNFMDLKGEHSLGLADSGSDKIVLGDVKNFPAPFWFVTFLCLTFYSAIFPFTSLATDMFHDKWGFPSTAGTSGGFLVRVFGNFLHMFSTAPGVTSIIIFASMICAPFAGKLVDRIGRRASLMILGSLILIPCHLIMGLTTLDPRLAMVFLGAAFVLVPAAMWPSIPLCVDKKAVGTAFGLCTAIQNTGLALFPYLNGRLRDATGGYTATQIMFALLGTAGLVFALLLRRSDRKLGGVLEAPTTTQ